MAHGGMQLFVLYRHFPWRIQTKSSWSKQVTPRAFKVVLYQTYFDRSFCCHASVGWHDANQSKLHGNGTSDRRLFLLHLRGSFRDIQIGDGAFDHLGGSGDGFGECGMRMDR
jgi:hypothetical protein